VPPLGGLRVVVVTRWTPTIVVVGMGRVVVGAPVVEVTVGRRVVVRVTGGTVLAGGRCPVVDVVGGAVVVVTDAVVVGAGTVLEVGTVGRVLIGVVVVVVVESAGAAEPGAGAGALLAIDQGYRLLSGGFRGKPSGTAAGLCAWNGTAGDRVALPEGSRPEGTGFLPEGGGRDAEAVRNPSRIRAETCPDPIATPGGTTSGSVSGRKGIRFLHAQPQRHLYRRPGRRADRGQ
jgi:hypothetical protein